MPDDKKYKLWESLNSNGYYTKTYEDFNTQFSTPESQTKLYQSLNSSGYYTKSGDEFTTQFFGENGKKKVSEAESVPTSDVSSIGSLAAKTGVQEVKKEEGGAVALTKKAAETSLEAQGLTLEDVEIQRAKEDFDAAQAKLEAQKGKKVEAKVLGMNVPTSIDYDKVLQDNVAEAEQKYNALVTSKGFKDDTNNNNLYDLQTMQPVSIPNGDSGKWMQDFMNKTLGEDEEFKGKKVSDLDFSQQRKLQYEFLTRYQPKENYAKWLKDNGQDIDLNKAAHAAGMAGKGFMDIFASSLQLTRQLGTEAVASEDYINKLYNQAYVGAITQTEYEEKIKEAKTQFKAVLENESEKDPRWVEGFLEKIPDSYDEVYQQFLKGESSTAIPQYDNPISEAGNKLEELADKIKVNPKYLNSFGLTTLPQAGGSLAAFALGGILTGGGGAAMLGASSNAQMIYEQAIAQGDSPEKALTALGWAGAIGASEALPIERFLGTFSKIGGSKIINGLVVGSTEALQEGFQGISNDVLMKWIDDSTKIGGTVGEGTGAGFVTGFLLGLIPKVRQHGNLNKEQLSRLDEIEVELQEQAPTVEDVDTEIKPVETTSPKSEEKIPETEKDAVKEEKAVVEVKPEPTLEEKKAAKLESLRISKEKLAAQQAEELKLKEDEKISEETQTEEIIPAEQTEEVAEVQLKESLVAEKPVPTTKEEIVQPIVQEKEVKVGSGVVVDVELPKILNEKQQGSLFKGETWKSLADNVSVYFLPKFRKPLVLESRGEKLSDNFTKTYSDADIQQFVDDYKQYPNATVKVQADKNSVSFPKEVSDYLHKKLEQSLPTQEKEKEVPQTKEEEYTKSLDKKLPISVGTVDGRVVRDKVPNMSSIGATLGDNYETLSGIREIPFTEFPDMGELEYGDKKTEDRTKKLAEEINESGEINPLIVVYDESGAYILEGGHRFDALRELGAKSFPAKVVIDTESISKASNQSPPSTSLEAPTTEELKKEDTLPVEEDKVAEKAKEEEFNKKSVEELVVLKKELYPNPDIESAMSPDEKLLNKVIAKKFSEINERVRKKREAKEKSGEKPKRVSSREKRAAVQTETTQDIIADNLGYVGRKSFVGWADENDIGMSIGRTWLRKDGRTLDQIAHELKNRHPQLEGIDEKDLIQEIVQFIKDNPNGAYTHWNKRYEEVTGQEDKQAKAMERMTPLAHEILEEDVEVDMSDVSEKADDTEIFEGDRNALFNYLSKFSDENGDVDLKRLMESAEGFDPDFIELSKNVTEQVKQLLYEYQESDKGTGSKPDTQNDNDVKEEKQTPKQQAESEIKDLKSQRVEAQNKVNRLSKGLSKNLTENQISLLGENKTQSLFDDKSSQQQVFVQAKKDLAEIDEKIKKAEEKLIRESDKEGQREIGFKEKSIDEKITSKKESLKENKNKLNNLGILDDSNKIRAQIMADLTDLAFLYIEKVGKEGIKTLEGFAEFLGEKVDEFIREAWEKAGGVNYTPDKDLSPEHSAIETKFGKELNDNYEANKQEYLKRFGNIINTDNARELSEDYNKNRGELSAVVQEPASAFKTKVYKDLLKEKPVSNIVEFTAGGTGVGKTTSNKSTIKPDIVYDGNLDDVKSAISKIDDALNAGRKVVVNYVYRGIEDAFEDGVIPRMKRIGRSVPIAVHVKTHTGSLETIPALIEHYKENPNVAFHFFDNSFTKGNSKEVSFGEIQEKAYLQNSDEIKNKLYESANKKLQAGEITPEQHKGLLVGTDTAGLGETVNEGGRRVSGSTKIESNERLEKSRQEQLEEEPEKKKKKLLNRAFEGDTTEELKEAIEKHGLHYQVESHAEAKQSAINFIEEVGAEQALDAVRRNMIEDGAAAFVWAEIIDDVGNKLSLAKSDEEISALEKLESDLIAEFDRKARSGGRFISALSDVYKNSDFGYKLTTQIEKYKSVNEGFIPPEVEARFRELDRQLTEVKEKLAAAEQKEADRLEQEAVDNIKEDVERNKRGESISPQELEQKILEGVEAEINKIHAKLPTARKVRADKAVAALENIQKRLRGRAYDATIGIPVAIIDSGITVIKHAIKTGVAIADAIEIGINHIRDKYGKKWDKEDVFRSDMLDEFEKEGIDTSKGKDKPLVDKKGKLSIPHELIRDLVERGITNAKELFAAVHEIVQKDLPDVTVRQVRDAITQYGKISNPNPEEIETEIRKIRRVGRIISALEDIQNKKRPLKSGPQRDKLDAEERALAKKLREAMKELPLDETTKAKELKSSLDAIKTRLRNQIEDLEREIETKEKNVRAEKDIAYDDEIKALMSERDRIKKIRDEIFGEEELTEEQKIERAIKTTERAITEVERQIAEKDLEIKKANRVDSKKLRAAREKLQERKEELRTLRDKAGITDKRSLEQVKGRTQKRIDELTERIRTKNFSKRKKKEIIEDSELIKLQADKLRLQEEYDSEQYKNELKNRSAGVKLADGVIEAWNLTRALRATGEFSFMLIQGGFYTISHPIIAAKSFGKAVSHLLSEKRSQEWQRNIRAQSWYPNIKQDKLAITETDAKLNAKEEQFISGWVNHLWNLIGTPLKLISKSAYEVWKNINPSKAFERAAIGFLNTIRILRYFDGVKMLEMQGKTRKSHPQDFKNVADVVNTFTGRASIGKLELISKPLAIVFFSPRNWASMLKQFTPYAFYHFGKMGSRAEGESLGSQIRKGKFKPSVAQKMVMADYMKYVALTTGVVMLIKQAFDDDDEISVEMNPTSSDFMKIKIGNTRIDPWGGRQQMVVLQARMIANSTKSSTTGKITPLGTPYKSPTRLGLMSQQARNKFAPSMQLFVKALDAYRNKEGEQVDKYGNPYEMSEEVVNNLYPIYWETFNEIQADQPATVAAFLEFYAFFGGGIQVYEQKKK